MAKRYTARRWTYDEVEILRCYGSILGDRGLYQRLNGRHTIIAIRSKLRNLKINKTPARLSYSTAYAARARWRCSRCGCEQPVQRLALADTSGASSAQARSVGG